MKGVDYLIRQLEASDQAFLWEVLYHSLYVPRGAEPFSRDVLTQPEISRYVEAWGRRGDLGLAAVNRTSGQPIGAAWLRLMIDSESGYGYIDNETPELGMAVLPEYRNSGIGTELLRGLLDAAAVMYARVCLSVSRENPAIRLYERTGFVTVNADNSSIIMMRSLL